MEPSRRIIDQRTSGLLLHPTSLPGPGPIGTLGRAAFAFVDFLHEAGQGVWQMLPLGPTDGGGFPYGALSALACNTWLLDRDALADDGLRLGPEPTPASTPTVDFAAAAERARRLVIEAHTAFRSSAPPALHQAFAEFRERERDWLDDWALFSVFRHHHGYRSWVDWPAELRDRHPAAIVRARGELGEAIEREELAQFLFDRQWTALRRHAEGRGVRLCGDIPIYVAHDSADVWANRQLFELGDDGRPSFVAGVPPDYFSATGQRWGNPLYRWDLLARHGYDWWVRRFRHVFEQFHVVRIDHFRGFEAYWRIPASEPTAVHGEWISGPRDDLFEAVERALGPLDVIAEDLGLIDDAVRALRDRFGFLGMCILQFAFGGGDDHPYLPANYTERCVAYPGTHDNDTTVGWYATLGETERDHLHRLLGGVPAEPAWALIEEAFRSRANLAVATVQDLLALPSSARMNIPGVAHGNWAFRLEGGIDGPGPLNRALAARLATLTRQCGR